MTREEFEAGKVFKIIHKRHKYVSPARPDDLGHIVTLFGSEKDHTANVKRITDDGCEFYGYVMNQSVDGYFDFSKCEIVEP